MKIIILINNKMLISHEYIVMIIIFKSNNYIHKNVTISELLLIVIYLIFILHYNYIECQVD